MHRPLSHARKLKPLTVSLRRIGLLMSWLPALAIAAPVTLGTGAAGCTSDRPRQLQMQRVTINL